MISILTPTRGRPDMALRMMESAGDCEHLFYVDDDDESDYSAIPHIRGPRVRLGVAWNFLARMAAGDYLMMGNDDLIFRDDNWQERLKEEVKPNELKVACFNDGLNGPKHFAFPIVTRAWYERMGQFVPELFSFGFHDTWIFDIAQRTNRAVYIGDVLVEHMHPTCGKRPADKTFRERNWADDPQRFKATEGTRIDIARMLEYEESSRI